MSAILSADDLNDFISPGVACIKPVELVNPEKEEAGEVEIQIDENGNPLEISKIDGKAAALSPAQISLADCLACSGCITSAEEVLVAQHSHEQLLKAIEENQTSKKVFVASISHQSRASLAHAYGYSVEQMDRLLINLFANQMGFQYIVGTALGRKLSLLQEAQGMFARKEHGPQSPVLLSICPGWVLYAEKTHPYVLPLLSATKSPQQITGCLLKTLVAKDLGILRNDIYHLSIMPCFDKKLESARPENTPVETSAPDVDCVLTAKELINLVETLKYELLPPNASKIAAQSSNIYQQMAPLSWPYKELSWANDSGSQSGGYSHNYLMLTRNHMVCRQPDVYQEEDFDVVTVEGRNSDTYEMRLMHKPTGKKIASAAVVNGFKNIQNLVRKLKPAPGGAAKQGKVNPLAARRRARAGAKNGAVGSEVATETADASKCDYVEVMACPDGCINGGGQITRPQDVTEKEWLSQVKDIYQEMGVMDLSSMDNVKMAEEIEKWAEGFCKESEIPSERLYVTHFNEVEKPTDPNAVLLGAKW